MWRRSASAGVSNLAPLVDACEAGRDLGAILAIACQTLEDVLPATAAAAYTLSEDAASFNRVCGDGPDQLPGGRRRRTLAGAGRRCTCRSSAPAECWAA